MYQLNSVQTEKRNNISMYKYYMEMHAITFSNTLVSRGGEEIREYIKNPDHVSNIIEGIKLAEFQYLVASKYARNEGRQHKSIPSFQSQALINGYLSELRAYRTHLYDNNQTPYENINQIYTDIDDLIKISKWLNQNNEFLVYSDQDFYKGVYPQLESNLKKKFF